jgi:hypothetical protein
MQSAFFLSHLKVDVSTRDSSLWRDIELIWGKCRQRLVQETVVLECELNTTPDCEILWKGFGADRVTCAGEVVPRLESWVYSELRRRHATNEVALHAAGVVFKGQVLLFIGASGAGKSSLALAALDQGCTYISDEIVCFNREVFWGVPRAIQFDLRSEAQELPRRLQRDDVLFRQVSNRIGVRSRAPIVQPISDQVIKAPVASSHPWLIFTSHSNDNALIPCEPLAALQGLCEAAMVKPSFDLGWLVNRGQCLHLRWNDPAAAMNLLTRRLQI